MTNIRVAIIGSGLSGLSCAHQLLDNSPKGLFTVTCFEKSRGPGGRMSTRRVPDHPTPNGKVDLSFDHGAQYFSVREPEFKEQANRWKESGKAEVWGVKIAALENGNVEYKEGGPERFVGVTGMNTVCKEYAQGLDIKLNTLIKKIQHIDDGRQWSLLADSGETFEPFDWVVLTPPAPQTADLLAGVDDEMEKKSRDVVYAPCWAGMFTFPSPVGLPYSAAFVNEDPVLSWISRNSSKPGRPEPESWVLHGNKEFSRKHLEEKPEEIEPKLLEAFYRATGVKPSEENLPYHAAFRWRYSQPEPIADQFLINIDKKIGACGDWCAGSKVEGAYMSGLRLGKVILQHHAAESTLRSNV